MRRAETLTWNRIGAKRSELPPNVDLTVEQMTPSVFPIMSVVLTGGDNAAQLRDYAFYQLAPLIKNIPDVLYANVAGGDVREIEVIARPDDLLAHGLSAADLADQIAQQRSLQPVGRIEGQPFAFQIIVNNQAETVRQIEEMVISTRKDQPLRVRDVADVKVLHQDRGLSIGFDQRDAVVITVFRRWAATRSISRATLRALLDKNQLTLPPTIRRKQPPRNIQATVVYDQADFVDDRGGQCARRHPDRRAVQHPDPARLPAQLAGDADLGAGHSDDAGDHVPVPALERRDAEPDVARRPGGRHRPHHRRHGRGDREHRAAPRAGARTGVRGQGSGVRERTTDGAGSRTVNVSLSPGASLDRDPVDAASGEITGAVVGSTLTTVLVFVPLAFIVGVYGQFFAALSWSLSIAVLVSMVISLTLVPVFAAKFLAGRPMPEPGRSIASSRDVYERGADGCPALSVG